MPTYSKHLNLPDKLDNGTLFVHPEPGKWSPVGLISDTISYGLSICNFDLEQIPPIVIHLDDTDRVNKHLQALSTLILTMQNNGCQSINILSNGKKIALSDIICNNNKINNKIKKWVNAIEDNQKKRTPQSPVDNESSFVWYHNVTNPHWSGRVEGLQVLSSPGSSVSIGKPENSKYSEKKSHAGRIFKQLVEQSGSDQNTLIKEICKSRKMTQRDSYSHHSPKPPTSLAHCEREHHLESRILRGDIHVKASINDEEHTLERATALNFQFPTLWDWRDDEKPRYVDALMKYNEIPYILELKINSSGEGQYYRHAVTQAVLYREFIRKAQTVHDWFKKQGLNATKCEAAVVLPEGTTPEHLDHVRLLAKVWGVQVLTVPDR